MPLDYEKLYREAYKKNVDDVASAIQKSDKVQNFCSLHEFDEDAVIKEIESNRIVAACFAINPNKQNFYERVAADAIGKMKGVCAFENLSNNKLVVHGGAVMKKKELNKSGGEATAKTIDFEWKYGGLTFYASHKYTKESGGSQDMQYSDLKAFIEASGKSTLENTCFIAIADGEYYQQKAGNLKKIDVLKQRASGPVVYACTIDELEELLKKIANEQQ